MFAKILYMFILFALIKSSESEEMGTIGFPMLAKCETEMQVVDFQHKLINNNRELYPSCTRVHQCSGCCSNKKNCLPNKIKKIRYSVNLINSLTQRTIRNVTVEVEEHLDCECQCKLTAKDCEPFQLYNANKCACECNNNTKKSCQDQIRENSQMLTWNEETCSCDCIDYCTTGTHLNKECECVDDDG